MKIENIISEIYRVIVIAKLTHWNVSKKQGSYAQHIALDELYENLSGLVDEYVETYQGEFGIINNITVTNTSVAVGFQFIKQLLTTLDNNKEVCCPNSYLSNIIDEIRATCRKQLYKLENLM